mmetsp:Transcript_17785/g.34775  ORF Transcript_17785/g.34775 Transcript_17785/m.34775 type:complete len:317 (-) Transcript_17785:56-1006(-)
MRRDGKDVIIAGLEADLAKRGAQVREKVAEIERLEGRAKLQQDLIRDLELEALDLRSETILCKQRVDDLEQLCESQSHDVGAYRTRFHKALQELEGCRATLLSMQLKTAVTSSEHHDDERTARQSLGAERRQQAAALESATHAIASLEAAAKETSVRHARQVAGLEGRIQALQRELYANRRTSTWLAAATETERRAADYRVQAVQGQRGDEVAKSREDAAAAESRAAKGEQELREATQKISSLEAERASASRRAESGAAEELQLLVQRLKGEIDALREAKRLNRHWSAGDGAGAGAAEPVHAEGGHGTSAGWVVRS